jgi:hypothetical protein
MKASKILYFRLYMYIFGSKSKVDEKNCVNVRGLWRKLLTFLFCLSFCHLKCHGPCIIQEDHSRIFSSPTGLMGFRIYWETIGLRVLKHQKQM